MRSPRRGTGALAGTMAAAATGGLLFLAGCPSPEPPPGPVDVDMAAPRPLVRVDPKTGKSLANVMRPLTAVIDSAGKTIYLTAYDADGFAQLYSVAAGGGTPSKIATTPALSHPTYMAMARDDSSLFIADGGDAGGTGNAGVVYRATLGGNLTPIITDELRSPAGVTVSPDGRTVYAVGTDKTDGQAGIWQVPAAGGTPGLLLKGGLLSSPSAIVHANDGTLYVADSTAISTSEGAILKIVGGGTAMRHSKTALSLGFPAGLAPSGPSDLLVTSNATGAATINKVSAAGDVTALALAGEGLGKDGDPSTIHQSANSNAWVVIDTAIVPQPTADTITGKILLLTP